MKKFLLIAFIMICAKVVLAQTMVVEMINNINNIQYSALCVFYGEYGRCHATSSSIGDCWYDAKYTENGGGRISVYNPTSYNWIPADFYFYNKQSHWICIQGQFFPIKSWRIKEKDWNRIMDEYGFPKRR